jgi:haloalkane dehalogenase
MKMKIAWKAALLALVAFFFAGFPANGQSTTATQNLIERTNLRNVRYCEILVANRQGGSAKASVYNTLGLNDCPETKWAALNADKLKTELHASMVVLNGPRYFTMDRNTLAHPGNLATFDGLDARLLAQLEIKKKQDRTPYTEKIIHRQNQYGYDRGKNAYELVAPGGRVYIMQSYSREINKTLNEEGLLTLQDRLKLPNGWEYRVRKLEEDLVVRNSDGKAHVVQDDLRNSYELMQ